jgi:hypothetical protein
MNRTITGTSRSLESRLDAVGWGLFFLISGVVLLVPGLPDGSWLVGVGALFLGLSAVRSTTGLPVSRFAVVVGMIAVAAGAVAIAGWTVPWFALLLVVCGLAIVAREFIGKSRQD